MPRINPTIKGTLILTAAVTFFVGAVALAIISQEPIRDEKLCIASREAKHTIVIVDKTDLWNDNQAQRLEDHIYWLVAKRVVPEERLSIFSFGDKFAPGFFPIFSVCKPVGAEAANDITSSKAYF